MCSSGRPNAISKRTNNQLFYSTFGWRFGQTGVEFPTFTKPWTLHATFRKFQINLIMLKESNPKFRVQPQYKSLIFICLVFILVPIFPLRNNLFYALSWALLILLIFSIYVILKKQVLLFEDYFTIRSILNTKPDINEIRLPYSCIKYTKCHMSSALGGNLIIICYDYNNFQFKRRFEFDGNAPLQVLKFLNSKNVKLIIDSANVSKEVFS